MFYALRSHGIKAVLGSYIVEIHFKGTVSVVTIYCKFMEYHVTRYLLKVSFIFFYRLMLQGYSCKSGIAIFVLSVT